MQIKETFLFSPRIKVGIDHPKSIQSLSSIKTKKVNVPKYKKMAYGKKS